MSLHIVLGGNGAIGRETVHALHEAQLDVVSVGRRPPATDSGSFRQADLLDADQTLRAVSGAETVYLTAGLPYSSRIWARDWPVIVRNAADAAARSGARLVYFDNVYAYGLVNGPMTEETPLRPVSRKGRVRADVRESLASFPDVVTAVAADFYGPRASTSVFNRFAVDAIRRGRRGGWLFNADLPHSMTFTPDIGRALAVLGTTVDLPRRTWHLPTAPPLRGSDYVELAGGAHGRTRVITRGQLRLAGLVNTDARDTLEMGYQYESPYLFDSSAFEDRFAIEPTSYAEGIAQTVRAASGA
ncbi:nucleoside-diphosphate-sugar epimerase [Microbacterium resistens]|uniref:Nucleoside-diphosphate-sugar epimerase n=1 Tax=Microbacterium resistens TaxID=156977 RepID=A0ABU1S8Z9_9MICO|nr:NAD-dependent epimerase/dehydratase family protein [Microbacterium resistens]MDR6866095.1 nucleoside-diphosphate-sugar epimerase [Microbacterium resistens]